MSRLAESFLIDAAHSPANNAVWKTLLEQTNGGCTAPIAVWLAPKSANLTITLP